MTAIQFIGVFTAGFITGCLALMALRVILFRMNILADRYKREKEGEQ